ncbi:hypothetical protein GS506_00145 [Rhodococcus hoagii]|nr:hypothetical protein [Prescottella equi]
MFTCQRFRRHVLKPAASKGRSRPGVHEEAAGRHRERDGPTALARSPKVDDHPHSAAQTREVSSTHTSWARRLKAPAPPPTMNNRPQRLGSLGYRSEISSRSSNWNRF